MKTYTSIRMAEGEEQKNMTREEYRRIIHWRTSIRTRPPNGHLFDTREEAVKHNFSRAS